MHLDGAPPPSRRDGLFTAQERGLHVLANSCATGAWVQHSAEQSAGSNLDPERCATLRFGRPLFDT